VRRDRRYIRCPRSFHFNSLIAPTIINNHRDSSLIYGAQLAFRRDEGVYSGSWSESEELLKKRARRSELSIGECFIFLEKTTAFLIWFNFAVSGLIQYSATVFDIVKDSNPGDKQGFGNHLLDMDIQVTTLHVSAKQVSQRSHKSRLQAGWAVCMLAAKQTLIRCNNHSPRTMNGQRLFTARLDFKDPWTAQEVCSSQFLLHI
jgi:hypothetical protein